MITDARSSRTDERDRLGQEAMGDKAEDLLRRLVEPLRVVDDADQGLLLGQLAHEREGREPDHEPVRNRAGTEPEHGRQRLALWLRKPFELTQHRGADLVEPAVGELELGLDSDGARDAPAIEPVREVVEQRALADACLAAKDQDPTSAVENVRHGLLERLALCVASKKPWLAFGASMDMGS